MGKYFGTDGFRGEANVDLTVEHAYKVGRFLGWYYGQKTPDERCRVVIGKDTRRSSYMFEYSLVAGLKACPMVKISGGRMPTCSTSPPPPACPMWCAQRDLTAES